MTYDLCEAIRKKEVIQFYYDGGLRVVEPFCYGENAKGNLVLRGYQIEGYSSSGKNVGWKLYKTSDMIDIMPTAIYFTDIRPYYNPNDKGMVRIICNV